MLCINSIYSSHVMEHCLIQLNVCGTVSYSLLLACFLVCISGLFFVFCFCFWVGDRGQFRRGVQNFKLG